MHILLVEDDQFKASNIEQFLDETVPDVVLSHARSVSTAANAVNESHFDLILLDMSLPSFDVGPGEQGGKPQGFGGLDILRILDTLDKPTKVVVVTQFEMFGVGQDSIDLAGLRARLLADFPDLVVGVVYFDTTGTTWRKELTEFLKEAQ